MIDPGRFGTNVSPPLAARRAVAPGAPGSIPAPAAEWKDPALYAELARMAAEDQADRMAAAADPNPHSDAWKRTMADDRKHHDLLVPLMGSRWPGYRKIGVIGSHDAWLLAQHQDADVPFQRHCLNLLRAAVARQDASPQDLAYLTDRVRRNEGRNQLYGTQFVETASGLRMAPTDDVAHLDERRADVGLASEKSYRQNMDLEEIQPHDRALVERLKAMESGYEQAAQAAAAHPGDATAAARLAAVVADNRKLIDGVLAGGWPALRDIGEEGNVYLSNLVDEQQDDLPFRQHALNLLNAAVARGDALPAWTTVLTDRVRLAEGRGQRYGTQIADTSAGPQVVQPVEDPKSLDRRRWDAGLTTEEAQLQARRDIVRFGLRP